MITFNPEEILSASDEDAQILMSRAVEKAGMMTKPVCICVYPMNGLPQQRRMKTAEERSVDIALLKAKTAALMKMTTADLHEKILADPRLACILQTNGGMVDIPGGYPIKHEGRVIGGLGISGGHHTDHDCPIAEFALDIKE